MYANDTPTPAVASVLKCPINAASTTLYNAVTIMLIMVGTESATISTGIGVSVM